MNLDTQRKMKIVYYALADSSILIFAWIMAFYLYRLTGGFRDVWAQPGNPFIGDKIAYSIMIYIPLMSISRYLDGKFGKPHKISMENISRALYVLFYLLIIMLGFNDHMLFFVSFLFVILTLTLTLTLNICVKSSMVYETLENIISPNKINILLVAFSFVLILSGLTKVLYKNKAADLLAAMAYLLLLAGIIAEVIRIYNKKTEK
jgi:hypothetical protein